MRTHTLTLTNKPQAVAILATLMALILCSCGRKRNHELLLRAESFLPVQADSADSVLRLVPPYRKLSIADKALYGLLRTYTDNRRRKGILSDSLIAFSQKYYEQQASDRNVSDSAQIRRYGQACYYLGLYYDSCDSTKLKEDQFRKAISASERCADWHTCYLAYTQLGISSMMSNPEYAVKMTRKALSCYYKIEDDVNNEALILAKIAKCYLHNSDFDNSISYYQKALDTAEKHRLTLTANQICMGIADVYMYLGKKALSLAYAKRGIQSAEGKRWIPSALTMVKLYLMNDSIDQAYDLLMNVAVDSTDYKYGYFYNLI